jgi:proliferating cell nuclear antigen PCNA
MKVIIKDPVKVKQFISVFKHLKHISEDVNLIFDEEKLYSQGMHPSHASLFELNLEKEWFSEYDVQERHMLGINCEILFKTVNCIADGQHIILSLTKSQDKLKLNFQGVGTIQKEFVLPLMTIDTELMEIPNNVEYSADIVMSSDQLNSLITQLAIFGEKITVKCNEEFIQLSCSGDSGVMTTKIKEEDIIEYALEETQDGGFCETVELVYALKFINTFCMFSKLNKKVLLHVSSEYPLKMMYDLDSWMDDDDEEDRESCNWIKFFVAPKVEDF